MRRLIFVNKVGKNENSYIVGSTIGAKSRFVKSALNKRSSNNSQGKCCTFKDKPSIAQTYSINVVGYDYYYNLSGTDRGGSVSGTHQQVDLNVGDTVNFIVTMNAGSHPFFIRNSSNNNVTLDSGTQGTTNGTLTWTPTSSGTYYYICGSHGSMRRDIIVT